MHGWSAALRPLLGEPSPSVARRSARPARVARDVAGRIQRGRALIEAAREVLPVVARGGEDSLRGLAVADAEGVVLLAEPPSEGRPAPGEQLFDSTDPAASALHRGRAAVILHTPPSGADLLLPIRERAGAVVHGILLARCAVDPPPAPILALLMQTAHRLASGVEAEAGRTYYDAVIATIGHELRQPLSALVTALDLMERRGTAGAPHALDVARRQTRHLIRLANNVLDASRLARRRLVMTPRRLDLRGVLQAAAEVVHDAIASRGQRLTLELPAQPVRCLADASRLQQVFVNLLANATRYTPEGGAIAVGLRVAGGRIIVNVSDTGIGLEPGAADRIFTAFTQESPGAREGLGLGLTICRGIVDAHGGSIEVESAGLGRGSTFTVHLPELAPPARAMLAPPRRRRDLRAGGGTRPRS